MDRYAPRAGRLRSGRLVVLCLAAILAATACGSPADGAGDGAGDAGQIIAEAQSIIGTSMLAGEVEGDTITITLVDGFGPGGAELFMCSNIKAVLAKRDPAGTLKVVMVDSTGKLADSTDC